MKYIAFWNHTGRLTYQTARRSNGGFLPALNRVLFIMAKPECKSIKFFQSNIMLQTTKIQWEHEFLKKNKNIFSLKIYRKLDKFKDPPKIMLNLSPSLFWSFHLPIFLSTASKTYWKKDYQVEPFCWFALAPGMHTTMDAGHVWMKAATGDS